MKRGSDVRILLPRMREHLSEKKEVLLSDKFEAWEKKHKKKIICILMILILCLLYAKLF
jgi:hypothetical protein